MENIHDGNAVKPPEGIWRTALWYVAAPFLGCVVLGILLYIDSHSDVFPFGLVSNLALIVYGVTALVLMIVAIVRFAKGQFLRALVPLIAVLILARN